MFKSTKTIAAVVLGLIAGSAGQAKATLVITFS